MNLNIKIELTEVDLIILIEFYLKKLSDHASSSYAAETIKERLAYFTNILYKSHKCR
jgi:hypothetical protein